MCGGGELAAPLLEFSDVAEVCAAGGGTTTSCWFSEKAPVASAGCLGSGKAGGSPYSEAGAPYSELSPPNPGRLYSPAIAGPCPPHLGSGQLNRHT